MSTEDRIQREMQETRASLSEKLDSLEQKVAGVVGTVEHVTSAVTTAVNDTVEAIKDTVQEAKSTVNTVNDNIHDSVRSVQESLDVTVYIRAHPWWVMAGSVAAGFYLGSHSNNRTVPSNNSAMPLGRAPERTTYANGNGHESRQTAYGETPAKDNWSQWAPEINKLKGLALGALFSTAREMIASSLPEGIAREVKEIIDSVTKKAGGEPISGPAFSELLQSRNN